PSVDLLAEVSDYLRSRCARATRLNVTGPSWVGADVEVTIASTSPDDIDAVLARVKTAVFQLLDPVVGGDGAGWHFGRKPRESDLTASITRAPGVDHVPRLKITCDAPFDQDDTTMEISIDALSLFNRLLVFARNVEVAVAQPKV